MNDDILLRVRSIQKSYPQGAGKLHILKGVDLDVRENEALCIVGSSGAGKSTLLHILGTLDRPDHGVVNFRGRDLTILDEEALAQFRSQSLGFVFQFHHLLMEFTALENVMLPALIAGRSQRMAKKKADELLRLVGLSHRATHFPTELSGGELQRVAIARSLVNDPEILFADEPTGNLDSQNAKHIQDIFFDLIKHKKITLVVVTHDLEFAKRFPRQLRMQDGRWLS